MWTNHVTWPNRSPWNDQTNVQALDFCAIGLDNSGHGLTHSDSMSKPPSPRRSVASVGILCKLGQKLGSSPSALLTGSSIAPAQLGDPHLEIEADQELQVVHNLVRLHGATPGLGMMAGEQYHLSTYGTWGYALITSSTFMQAVDLGLRYLDLTFAFSRIEFQRDTRLAHMVFSVDHLPPAVRQFVVERDSTALQVLQRELFGVSIALHAMEFSFPRHGSPEQYRAIYGCDPSFSMPLNRASIPAYLLDASLPKANPESLQACEQQLGLLLSRRSERGGTSAWIRNKLLADISAAPSLEEIASANFTTERTLRRRLTAEGTSYRELLAEVRQTMAEELLLVMRLSVSEVSARLGYSSVSAFIHAFHKWYGCSPSQFVNTRSQ